MSNPMSPVERFRMQFNENAAELKYIILDLLIETLNELKIDYISLTDKQMLRLLTAVNQCANMVFHAKGDKVNQQIGTFSSPMLENDTDKPVIMLLGKGAKPDKVITVANQILNDVVTQMLHKADRI